MQEHVHSENCNHDHAVEPTSAAAMPDLSALSPEDQVQLMKVLQNLATPKTKEEIANEKRRARNLRKTRNKVAVKGSLFVTKTERTRCTDRRMRKEKARRIRALNRLSKDVAKAKEQVETEVKETVKTSRSMPKASSGWTNNRAARRAKALAGK